MIISAIIRAVRDRLQFEDHAALVGSGVAVGLEVVSLTLTGNNAADVAALGAVILTSTIVLWYIAKLARRR